MKAIKSILLGSAAGFVSVAAAQAADLPTRKAAPIEYVRVCDAYGSGFFYIPGTDTCLRVGGAVVAEWRSYSTTSYRMSRNLLGLGKSAAPTTIAGFGTSFAALPGIGDYASGRSSDNQGFAGTGRIELDARTGTGFGTLRTFIRLESYFGSDTSTATGSLNSYGNPINGATFRSVARETTILNKAFIQFAGLTAGRVQSFFDFYTDNVNWEALRGSNATVGALAYTYTFGNGFSGTISIEDNISRRGLQGSTIGGYGFTYLGNLTGIVDADKAWGGASYGAVPAGVQVPEIVANLRYDAPWGAVQASGAAHQIRSTLYNNAAGSGSTGRPYGVPASTQDDFGFAAQLGAQFLLDKIAPEFFAAGDKLWVQGTYEQGAVGYVQGNNLSFNGGAVNGNTFYGFGNGGVKADNGWNFNAYDCVWTGFGRCDKNEGWAVLAALKHYWLPTLSSGFFGSYMGLRYSEAALAGFGGGISPVNVDEYRVGSNLIWTPVKNFDIGAEVTYLRDNYLNRPAGLAPNAALWAVGLPSWKGVNSTVEGRLRVQRTF